MFKCEIDAEFKALMKETTASDDHTETYEAMKTRLKFQTRVKTLTYNLEDIIGASSIKKAIQQGIIYPLTDPEYFTKENKRKPLSTLLLFGPPGVAKTSLAMAAGKAAIDKCQVFQLSPTAVTSSWSGHSKKLITAFFNMVKEKQPAIIIADELEGMFLSRTDENGGKSNSMSETSAELLIEIAKIQATSTVFFIGCCNHPDLLDRAFIRRFSPNVRADLISMPSYKL